MAWYKTGTVAVTNGSTAVVGTGTAWIANALAGDAFKGPDGVMYEIASVNSDTSITLAINYGGSTVSGASYGIQPTQSRVIGLDASVQSLITTYSSIATNASNGWNGDGTVSAPGISFSSDQDTGIFRPGANSLAWTLGGTEQMRLTSTGLGIGMTPAHPLDITKNQNAVTYARIVNTNAGASAVCAVEMTNGTQAVDFGQLGTGFTTNGVLVAGAGYIYSAGAIGLAMATAGPIKFATGATAEVARLSATGNLLVGTTSEPDGCHVISKSQNSGLAATIQNTNATNGYGLDIKSAAAAGTGFSLLRGYANSVKVVEIRGDGNVTNTNNSYGAISDRKYKEGITDAGRQWDDVKAWKLRKYTINGVTQLGVVADEIKQVSPGLVDTLPDVAPVEVKGKRKVERVKSPAVEASATLKPDGTPQRPARAAVLELVDEEYVERVENRPTGSTSDSVKYSILYLKSVGALQEAMVRIEALEARLLALESR